MSKTAGLLQKISKLFFIDILITINISWKIFDWSYVIRKSWNTIFRQCRWCRCKWLKNLKLVVSHVELLDSVAICPVSKLIFPNLWKIFWSIWLAHTYFLANLSYWYLRKVFPISIIAQISAWFYKARSHFWDHKIPFASNILSVNNDVWNIGMSNQRISYNLFKIWVKSGITWTTFEFLRWVPHRFIEKLLKSLGRDSSNYYRLHKSSCVRSIVYNDIIEISSPFYLYISYGSSII